MLFVNTFQTIILHFDCSILQLINGKVNVSDIYTRQ